MEVTRLLADKAVAALASKVSMLERLDQVMGYFEGPLEVGNQASSVRR